MGSEAVNKWIINENKLSMGQPVNTGSLEKTAFKTVCTCACICLTLRSLSHDLNFCSVIAQFAITINSNVCPHIRVLNTIMRESYA